MIRKAIQLPRWSMVLAFVIGFVLALLIGLQALIFSANTAASSFEALSTLLTMGIFTLVLIGALILLTIKLGYVMVAFWLGLFLGFIFITYLDLMGAIS